MDPKEEERHGDPDMGPTSGNDPTPPAPTVQVTLGGTDAGPADAVNPVLGSPRVVQPPAPPLVIHGAGDAHPGEANAAVSDLAPTGLPITETAKLLVDREFAEESISRHERLAQPELGANLTGAAPYADTLRDPALGREAQTGRNTAPQGAASPADYTDPQRDYISLGTFSATPGESSARVDAKNEANVKVSQQAESMSGLSSERNDYERQEFGLGQGTMVREDMMVGRMENLPQEADPARAVMAVFSNLGAAQKAIRGLHQIGILQEDISLVARDLSGGSDVEARTGQVVPAGETWPAEGEEAHVDAGRGAIFGGLAGLLVGLGALAIPGIGPIIAAGPLVAAITGLVAGGITGGLVGALIHAGVPHERANELAGRVERGDVLLSVHTDQLTHPAVVRVLQENGADVVH